MKNLAQMTKKVLVEYTALMASRRAETGTAQQDGEYEQAMQSWNDCVDSVATSS